MNHSRLAPLHLPLPNARVFRPDFRLRSAGPRVYVIPLSHAAEDWLGCRVSCNADAEWSDGTLVLGSASATAFVQAVRRDGLEVTR